LAAAVGAAAALVVGAVVGALAGAVVGFGAAAVVGCDADDEVDGLVPGPQAAISIRLALTQARRRVSMSPSVAPGPLTHGPRSLTDG
jgi:hypothetical protein